MQKILLTLLMILSLQMVNAQQQNNPPKPKLIVGLVVDQMRWDFLYRYENRYRSDGFKRLVGKGYSYDNALIPYVPTYTAVGHSTIYTGSVPALHGIIGNNWFDRQSGKGMYCTTDTSVRSVGGTGTPGQMSPKNLWSTTITDELRLATNFKSRVVGIALKDRGAILPAGHAANAAYWYDAGKWITSTFYMDELPSWVSSFNAKDFAGKMMTKDWETIYPLSTYTMSTVDEKHFESNIPGLKTNTFPHKLSSIGKEKYEAFKFTPFANTFTLDFAKEAIVNEKLGQAGATDFIAISLSSTDYIGHTFGPNSIEAEDMYLRLDADVAGFLKFLDNKIGAGNYLIFLSADHGAAHSVGFLDENEIPAGAFNEYAMRDSLNKLLNEKFAIKKAVADLQNYQVYLDHAMIKSEGKNVEDVIAVVKSHLRSLPFVTNVVELKNLPCENLAEPVKTMLVNGYNGVRSGDIQFVNKPAWFDGFTKGTTHGVWNPYDSHIPMVFYGWGIKPGKSFKNVSMTDIAPTIAAMLKIQMPNANVGTVLTDMLK